MKSKSTELFRLLESRKRVLVLSHTNPDPDSLGSALGLCHLARQRFGIECDCALDGRIMRAENREMVRRLEIPLVPIDQLHIPGYDCLAVVDTQPGFGHTHLPEGREIDIVIDHHVSPERGGATPAFADIRTDVGATSSIVTRYLIDAGVDVPTRVATALYYGVKTDTADLSRNVSPLDAAAYEFLTPRIDRSCLAGIASPALSPAYFSSLRQALNNVRIYDNVVLCSLGRIDSPEMVAEVADLLLRLEGKDTVFCGGEVDGTYFISVRTALSKIDAYDLIRDALAGEGSFGGHGSVAGGSVKMPDDGTRCVRRLERRLEKNILRAMGVEDVTVCGLAGPTPSRAD
ncbi:MAG: DHH family phosphoesterase [Planctomycetes bacterium]|nr:DHH family phosphoesterase [Planctomycetota bacterium]MCB9870430.1 DHH family phosphoesterase [Planctomycetota bacterium]MCB9889421.1 DHH family phosphoesterase [Planctomycetota bacterium]